ncbi:MAG: hypothetical protein FWF49_01290 [Oscillospiraceae bacterium]|nr:hypothetical protein [Oscillospiraceae bacterium]
MPMELLGNGCLRVLLTGEEMACLGFSFASLDDDEPTHTALLSILRAARRETGFCAPGGLLVEVLPLCDGCLLLFTPQPPARPHRVGGPYVFDVGTPDALLQILSGLPPALRSGTDTYRFGKGYRLVLYITGRLPAPVQWLLRECARDAGAGDAAAAYTAEHGTRLNAESGIRNAE